MRAAGRSALRVAIAVALLFLAGLAGASWRELQRPAEPALAAIPPSHCDAPDTAEAVSRCEFFIHYQRELNQLRERRAFSDMLERLEQHNVAAYRTQTALTWLVTLVLIAFITVALVLTFEQFRRDGGGGLGGSRTSITISRDGFQMSSSVLGFFVILASLFILYLYLKQVYAIQPVPLEGAPAAAATPQR